MKLAKLIEFLRSRLAAVVRICFGLLGLLIVLDAILVDKGHAHTALERWPAFWSIFGFLGCVLIVIASKWFGHAGIMTREDYYDE
jgi:drug/metabolite transporter (DMT)-like permease